MESPLFMLSIWVGTRERSCWQRASSVLFSGRMPPAPPLRVGSNIWRPLQFPETSANWPVVRMIPPSEASKN